jgi:hypothetical protein
VFLRIAEDRGIERYGQLQQLLSVGRIYPNLVDLFKNADDKYNSGLFHFREDHQTPEQPDTLTPGLNVSDQVLLKIVGRLYYPESP